MEYALLIAPLAIALVAIILRCRRPAVPARVEPQPETAPFTGLPNYFGPSGRVKLDRDIRRFSLALEQTDKPHKKAELSALLAECRRIERMMDA